VRVASIDTPSRNISYLSIAYSCSSGAVHVDVILLQVFVVDDTLAGASGTYPAVTAGDDIAE